MKNHTAALSTLAANSWRWAKAKANPHAYTLRKNWESDSEFCEVVQYIRDHGHVVYFWKKPYTILHLNGYRYWTMGYPIFNEDGTPLTILINKAVLEYEGCHVDYSDVRNLVTKTKEGGELLDKVFSSMNLQGRILDLNCISGLMLGDVQGLTTENYVGLCNSTEDLEEITSAYPNYEKSFIRSMYDDYNGGTFDTIVALFGAASYIKPAYLKSIREKLNKGGVAYLMFRTDDDQTLSYLRRGGLLAPYTNNYKGTLFGGYKMVVVKA